MTHFLRTVASALTLVAALTIALDTAHAQSADTKDGVFQIMKATETRVWRLNTQTGEIAVCDLQGENLVCTNSTNAAEVPAKTYAEIEAKRAAQAEADAAAREEQRAQDLKMLDRILDLIKEFIATALGQNAAS